MNSSESILDLFKKDENRAFQLLFNRYYDNLLLYCYHISGNLEAAEDIVQDCFINLWNSKRLVSFTGDLDRFIFKMIKNRSLLFLKEQKTRNNIQHEFPQENEFPYYEFSEEFSEEIELLYKTIRNSLRVMKSRLGLSPRLETGVQPPAVPSCHCT